MAVVEGFNMAIVFKMMVLVLVIVGLIRLFSRLSGRNTHSILKTVKPLKQSQPSTLPLKMISDEARADVKVERNRKAQNKRNKLKILK